MLSGFRFNETESQFLLKRLHGTFSTFSTANQIHSVPVNCVMIREDSEDLLAFLTGGRSAKVRNLKVNPTASFCVFERQSYLSCMGIVSVETSKNLLSHVEMLYTQKYQKVPRGNPSRVVMVMSVQQIISHKVG